MAQIAVQSVCRSVCRFDINRFDSLLCTYGIGIPCISTCECVRQRFSRNDQTLHMAGRKRDREREREKERKKTEYRGVCGMSLYWHSLSYKGAAIKKKMDDFISYPRSSTHVVAFSSMFFSKFHSSRFHRTTRTTSRSPAYSSVRFVSPNKLTELSLYWNWLHSSDPTHRC